MTVRFLGLSDPVVDRCLDANVLVQLVSQGGGLLCELGPLGRIERVASRLEAPAGEGDVLAGADVSLAMGRRRYDSVVAVEDRLYGEGVVAPHGLAGG